MHVVATAGHVDHGKSTLVRALTGMEPDRWAEERRRGMTIDLGFAWTTLEPEPEPEPGRAPKPEPGRAPKPEPGRAQKTEPEPGTRGGETVAFVDVPGHERFVPNMLAGVGPVPAAMMVVAADEGWRQQSAEHLAALHALDVRHGLLVVTRTDLADPAQALARARREISRTSLGDVPAVAVSAATGAGLDGVRAALRELVAGLPPAEDGPVRLWIDRAFTIRGAGTVVTGTLGAGRIAVGDELVLGGRTVRVRGLQSLGVARDVVAAPARVAVNLRHVAKEEAPRGSALLTPGRFLETELIDVRVHGEPVSELPATLTLHLGSASVPVRVRPLGVDTARLRLASGLPLRLGDRGLLRDPGRHAVPGGVTVLDVVPPGLGRRGAAARRAQVLDGLDGKPDLAGELARRRLARGSELARMGVAVDGAPVAGEWYADPEHWASLQVDLEREVAAHARDNPLAEGMPVEAVRNALGLPDRVLVPALVRPPLTVTGGRVTSKPASDFPAAVAASLEEAFAGLGDFAAPEANRLAELGLGTRQLAAAVRAGLLVRLADGVYLRPGAAGRAASVLAGIPQPFTLSEARRALGTTRRVAVPLLEHLDTTGATTRHPDDRRTAP
jgi:selenocysteine-specific elongation factor